MFLPPKLAITFNYVPEMKWRLIVKGKKVNWKSGKADKQEQEGCYGGLSSGNLKQMFQCTDADKKRKYTRTYETYSKYHQ